ncbi:unnamed protein product, partial [Ectocarpus sp. 8 AP-2014]
GDNLRFREHRKFLSGKMSGRVNAEQLDAPAGGGSGSEGGARAGTSSLSVYSAQAEADESAAAAAKAAAAAAAAKEAAEAVPALREAGQDLVEFEWWDEAFLTKETRDAKAAGKLEAEACTTDALYPVLLLENAKTFKYIQHPKKPLEEEAAAAAGAAAAAAAVGGGDGKAAAGGGADGSDAAAMKVYLTKKERKRIRRTTRMERERCVA